MDREAAEGRGRDLLFLDENLGTAHLPWNDVGTGASVAVESH